MPYQPGQEIINSKYRIEELIGEGAFAQVYRARHIKLNVQHALKVLRRDTPGVGSADYHRYRDRFFLEAQLSARLSCPELLAVHDFLEEDDTLILVMEYAPNGSLAALMERTRRNDNVMIPVQKVIQVGQAIAEGLAVLHAKDVVHRDLKPANILFDVNDRARVADLGLAQIPGGLSQRSLLSMDGGVLPLQPGTPEYMSPEQESSTRHLSPSSDIYALGLIMFEMLTGRTYKNLRVGTGSLQLRPETPLWLDALVAKMLIESPRERPLDGSEVGVFFNDGLTPGKENENAGQEMESQRIKAEVLRLESEQKIAQENKSLTNEKALQADREKESARQSAEKKALVEKEKKDASEREKGHIEWVEIPAGEFLYGEDKQKYSIRKPYLIGKYPVTNEQYKSFLDAHRNYHAPQGWDQNSKMFPAGKADHPVVYVSSNDAIAFCNWAACRLPTEVEWEKAARGIDGRTYPWGDKKPGANLLNFNNNVGDTTPVGNFPNGVSLYGAHDMAGNVWEWAGSLYKPYPYGGNDGREDLSSGDVRVLRGGSWVYDGYGVRSSDRIGIDRAYSCDNIGFRCARGTSP